MDEEKLMIKRDEIYNCVDGNKIFSMIYYKANGEVRTARCRLHVENPKYCQKPGTGKYIGESAAEALKNHNNIKYYDLDKLCYRTAKIDRIISIRACGKRYFVED